MTTHQHEDLIGDAERDAVACLLHRISAAWADHDAATFSKVFTEDGTMILPGVHCKGRAEIEKFMAGAFAGPYRGTRVTGTPFELRPLSPDTCLMLTRGGVLAPGEESVVEGRGVRASWLAVRGEDGWRLAAYQNTPLT